MKRFFTLLTCLFALIACEEATKPTTEPTPKAELKLTSAAEMLFNADGGQGEIRYTLTNPIDGVTLEVSDDAEWITDITMAESITFMVAVNEVEVERVGKITVTYLEQSFDVTIRQAAAEPAPLPDYLLTLTSASSFTFTATGGSGEITYTLENPREDIQLTADTDAPEWINDIEVSHSITFTVAANDIEVAREGKITITYGNQSFDVVVEQDEKSSEQPSKEYALDIKLDHLNGTYYGNYGGADAYNYYIHLSTNGLYDEDDFIGDGHVYRFDLYSSKSASGSSKKLPEGTYTIDCSNSFKAGTCSYEYSFYAPIKDGFPDGGMYGFEAGVITVTADRIEAELELYGGAIHHVVYEGSLVLGYI